jgi:hypothetical protein
MVTVTGKRTFSRFESFDMVIIFLHIIYISFILCALITHLLVADIWINAKHAVKRPSMSTVYCHTTGDRFPPQPRL